MADPTRRAPLPDELVSVRSGQRLSAHSLARARAVPLPTYDRGRTASIVHLGVGAFARAHLGVYIDDLSRLGRPTLIRGVSLRSERALGQLVVQDGLYTVSEREPGRDEPLRVIGSITRVDSGAAAAVDAVAASTTTLVTLTISEQGYDVEPEELEHPEDPHSAPGVIALALARRRRSGIPPPVLVSMDNVLGNGGVLRRRVMEVAGQIDDELPAWIADEVRFPTSVVDRMVPATTEQDLEETCARLGLIDLAAVVTEHHRSWVIESAPGLHPLAEVGVQLVGDIVPFERRKLWLLNGPHSALAYCGLLAGCSTIAAAATHPVVSSFVRRLVHDILEVADLPDVVEPERFAFEALHRFANPALRHTCIQVGADGSRKLPQRLLPIVEIRRRRGLATAGFATVVALWVASAAGVRLRGTPLSPIEDPASARLRAAAATADLRHVSHVALDGRCDPQFVLDVAAVLDHLVRDGMALLGGSR
jgi:fructuronate reductase